MAFGVKMLGVSGALPELIRTSAEVEDLVARSGGGFRPRAGLVRAMSGIRTRRVASDKEQCSDLATRACKSSGVDKNQY